MTHSEALAAWIDGKRVQIKRHGEWHDVHWFSPAGHGLTVWHNNTVGVVGSPVIGSDFRLADAPTEPKPTVEDSEAWGLLRDIREAVKCHGVLSGEFSSAYAALNGALKKRGMV